MDISSLSFTLLKFDVLDSVDRLIIHRALDYYTSPFSFGRALYYLVFRSPYFIEAYYRFLAIMSTDERAGAGFVHELENTLRQRAERTTDRPVNIPIPPPMTYSAPVTRTMQITAPSATPVAPPNPRPKYLTEQSIPCWTKCWVYRL